MTAVKVNLHCCSWLNNGHKSKHTLKTKVKSAQKNKTCCKCQYIIHMFCYKHHLQPRLKLPSFQFGRHCAMATIRGIDLQNGHFRLISVHQLKLSHGSMPTPRGHPHMSQDSQLCLHSFKLCDKLIFCSLQGP